MGETILGKKITIDKVGDAIINCANKCGLCDCDTTRGFKSSNKKSILKSSNENSFAKFTSEIKKRQMKKEGEI